MGGFHRSRSLFLAMLYLKCEIWVVLLCRSLPRVESDRFHFAISHLDWGVVDALADQSEEYRRFIT